VFDGQREEMTSSRKQEALELFAAIQAEFPSLRMNVDLTDPRIDVSVEILRQVGLRFDVYLNLQNDDELHLAAGEAFWSSWFPSSDREVRERYRHAVAGLLAGRNRIVEYRRWGKPVIADLQAPGAGGWETIAHSMHGLLPVSWGARKRILRNDEAVEQGDEADER
jgi:hypothetical protein